MLIRWLGNRGSVLFPQGKTGQDGKRSHNMNQYQAKSADALKPEQAEANELSQLFILQPGVPTLLPSWGYKTENNPGRRQMAEIKPFLQGPHWCLFHIHLYLRLKICLCVATCFTL